MRIIKWEVVGVAGVSGTELAAVQAREQAEVEARAMRYRFRRARQQLNGGVAVVVDDGIVTKSTTHLFEEPGTLDAAGRPGTGSSATSHNPDPVP